MGNLFELLLGGRVIVVLVCTGELVDVLAGNSEDQKTYRGGT
jgi:hypothetical protein